MQRRTLLRQISAGAGLTVLAPALLRAAEPLKELRLDYAYYSPCSLVLRRFGWLEEDYRRDGTSVRWVLSAGSNRALEYLNAGSIDIGSSAGLAALLGKANGNAIRTPYIFSRPEWTALVVGKDSPIKSLNDLKGKKVAATKGTDPYLFLLRALHTVGLKRSDIEHVALQHADGRAALEQGRVDAWAGLDPLMAASELDAGSKLIYRNVAFNTYGVLLSIELAVRLGWVESHLLPAPTEVIRTLLSFGWSGLALHVGASALRVALGFMLGAGMALVIGSAVGLSRLAEAIVDPTFQALRAIPSLAWVPVLLLWLGIDEAPKLVLIAIGAFFPVYMGVASGFRDVDRRLLDLGRVYRIGRLKMLRRILLPSAVPSIVTGLRNGLSLAWMFMVAAELIAASKGLGYLLTDGRETGRADIVFAAIVMLALLGKTSDSAMRALEGHLLRWRDSDETPL